MQRSTQQNGTSNEKHFLSCLQALKKSCSDWESTMSYSCNECNSPIQSGETRYRCLMCPTHFDCCESCRRAGKSHDNTHAFQPYRDEKIMPVTPLQKRNLMNAMGLTKFAIKELLTGDHSVESDEILWDVLIQVALVRNAQDPLDLEPTEAAVDDRLIDVILMEMRRAPRRSDLLNTALLCLTSVCITEVNAEKIQKSGVIEACVSIMRKFLDNVKKDDVVSKVEEFIVESAISSVKSFSYFSRNRGFLEKRVLPTSIEFLKFLGSPDQLRVSMALSGGSIVCRVVGNRESGIGIDFIRSNALFLELLAKRLDEILDKPLSSHDPAGLVYDVSVLSKSDKNKPILGRFIPLLTKALQLRSDDNPRLVTFAVTALSQLSFEPSLREIFEKVKIQLLKLLEDVVTSGEKPETRRDAQALKVSLQESSTSQLPHQGKTSAVRRASGGFLKAAKLVKSGKSSPNGNNHTDGKHAMISYNWNSGKEVAIELERRLRACGIPTWLDVNDMPAGEDIMEAMATAVENAFVVLVLFSCEYKESTNCRRECMLAVDYRPMIYLRVQEDYTPDGWFRAVIQKALWIECENAEILQKNFSKILEGVAKRGSIKVEVTAPKQDTAVSQKGVGGGDQTVMEVLRDLTLEMKAVREEVSSLRKEVAALASKQ